MRQLPVRYAAALLLPMLTYGQSMNPVRVVRASAEATVTAKPDHAQIRIGVVSQGATAQAAASTNATRTTQVVNTLKAAVGKDGELKTTDYSIAPQYQYANNQPPKLTGYQASNTVLVEVNNIEAVGPIIDASVKAGANDVTGIAFSLKDDQPVRQQAIAQATVKAKANAEAIAKALGVQVTGVLEAETGGSGVAPVRPLAMMGRAQAALPQATTPVESGTLEIRADVTVTLQIQ